MPEVCNMRDLEGEKFVFGFNTGSFQNFLFKITFSIPKQVLIEICSMTGTLFPTTGIGFTISIML